MTGTPEGLLSWLDDPAEERGIRFAGPGDEWEFWSYRRLAELTRRVSTGLAARLEPGAVVGIVQGSGPSFVATLFGAMTAGCVPSPLAPPLAFQDADAYAAHAVGLLRSSRAAAVVADEDLVADLAPLAAVAGVRWVTTAGELTLGCPPDGPAPEARRPAELALVQFTSGSSGAARGVRVPRRAVEANVAAIRRWLEMTQVDVTASWLPVHHDMGLIGCLLAPVVNRSDLWLMRPEQFVRNPTRYLRCFDTSGATRGGGAALTAMPNFGLAHIVRRVRAEALRGVDLSGWRAVILGAERIDAAMLEAFDALLRPHGFSRRALLPAYGLAESTLAVTGLPLAEEWRATVVDPGGLEAGRRMPTPVSPGAGRRLVGCGRPLAGTTVEIRDDEGRLLPPGTLGEIVVRGPSVAAGYLEGTAEGSASAFLPDGGLRCGDAGFLGEDGQLYVLGRLGDSIKVRGRAVFAEDIESVLAEGGIPPSRAVALLGARAGVPTLVVVFESARPEWLAYAATCARARAEGVEMVLLDAPRGTVVRTSSGKPRRRLLWSRYLRGQLPGVVRSPGDQAVSNSAVATTGGVG
ncbi:AMP-binding protein [Plantactinospora sp. B6F1]|uniref:AMP-binding protein n=1 Tax=Plantactinospora sp. B6F1 TaxID=3158971 RepID=UPI00102CB889